jgi:hypothetical protein
MATKMKPTGWRDRDRNSQLAQALYPHLSDPETRKQMLDRAAEDGEGKRAGLERRTQQGEQMYGKPKPIEPSKYDGVPGLVRRADPLKLPDGALSLDGLQATYRNPRLPLQVRIRAMIAAIPFETPKLAVTYAATEKDFATLLDQRLKRIAEMKLIEAKPTNGEKADARLPPPIPDRRFRRI